MIWGGHCKFAWVVHIMLAISHPLIGYLNLSKPDVHRHIWKNWRLKWS